MKRIIFGLFALLLLIGCGTENKDIDTTKLQYKTIVIDSCEYIFMSADSYTGETGRGYGYMAHKGNCKYCAKRK